MKKLTLILSTVLLVSSSAAFAKRSRTSKVMKSDMGSSKNCKRVLNTLHSIATNEKDLSVEASCKGGILSAQWKVQYLRTPSQKFKIKLGHEYKIRPKGKRKWCKDVVILLRKISGNDFSYNASCQMRNTYRTLSGSSWVDGGHYSIEGEIRLKK